MELILKWGVFLCVFGVGGCQFLYNDYEKIPPLNQMDRFLQCREKENLFCLMQFTLRPKNTNSRVWQLIQKSKENPNAFNRDVVNRLRCFPRDLVKRKEELIGNATFRENSLLSNYSLNARLNTIDCKNYSEPKKLTTFDYSVLYSTLAWFGIIAAATLCDAVFRVGNFGEAWTYIKSLSLLSNWEDLRAPVKNEDYQRLKGLQGIRTYNMIIVILGHTVFNCLFSFTSDVGWIETFYRTGYRKFGLNFGLHIVQTNFVISAWVLSSNLYSYIEKNKKLSIKLILKWIFLRYLRLLPVLGFIVCWEMSNWPSIWIAGPPSERNDMDFRACQKNWWATLLLVNNYFLQSDMCNIGTWYLSNDFQMFLLAMILFYVMVNYKIGEEIILWTMGFFWLMHASLIYYNNYPVIFDFSPENSKVENSVGSNILCVLYSSFYSNFGGYGIGLIFGGLYHKYKNHTIKVNEVVTYSWLLVFFGLPISAVYLSLFEYPRLLSAILGATLKLVFSLGVAVGILGLSHGIGGVVKKICEWDYPVFLAKWAYSTYLVNFLIVFGRYLLIDELIPLNDEIMWKSIFSDIIQAFAAGLVVHLLIERPLSNVLRNLASQESTVKIKSR
ncbi:O-acyltransferase like protein isoform X1 [Leptinotarsa decemlineata]|uniref:O-acyltransferase like protein isoform X1 n=1 Tax=Leptinotarsa decemlineata TaxID=7539 RepID=UPI003D30CB41